MSFSARQLHCLDAMGIVGWISKHAPPAIHNDVSEAPAPAVPEPAEPMTSHATPMRGATLQAATLDAVLPAAPIPVAAMQADTKTSGDRVAVDRSAQASVASPEDGSSALSDLAMWLAQQPLTSFNYRGASLNCIGPEQASLLVVCLNDESTSGEPDQLPMSAVGTQLFDLMMRSINLSRSGFRQCVVQRVQSIHTHAGAAAGVDLLCTPQTRAVLVLDPTIENAAQGDKPDNCIMPASSLPLWRIPHPEQLLQTPLLKRRAWEALKNLQRVLAA